jgi:hypothetical protein
MFILIVAAQFLFIATETFAQYSLTWNTIDGGGGVSSGAAFALAGTIGQPDAGAAMSSGAFSLIGGFWAGHGDITPPCPADINNSGAIDVDDLIAVILAWGGCANCSNCPPDINGSCTVDVDDLIAVILAWGACP